MKNKVKRILAVFLMITIWFPSFNVSASQSRNSNYNKNYMLNGSPADNIVAVAQAQQGRTKAQLGYTEAWCADFVSDCAQLAGLGDIIPFDGYCWNLYNKVKNAGGYEVSSPKKGDLVFYYCSVCSVHWCHVGIMIDSQRSIEGNYGGKVSLVNGSYKDSAGHSLSNGIVTRRFVTPAYKNNSQSLITPQLSLAAGTNSYEKEQSITFNWTWGGSEADGYDLFIAKNIEGTEEYDWNNATRVFFPGNATTSGVVGSSVFASEGAYAAYMQACAPNDKRSGQSNFVWFKVKNVTPKRGTAQGDVWISRTKMGEETDVVPVGKTCYLCYKITDKETKKNWDELYQSNYNVKETITKSDSEICCSYSYTNDNNWIAITPEEAGEYKGIAEITGDFAGELECSFIAKEFYYGDINADDDITVTDLAMMLQAADDAEILTEDQKKRADVNADGAVTEEDITLVREYVLGTIREFPAEGHVHSYSSEVTKDATCTSTGIRTYTCICGESYEETIPLVGHTPVTEQEAEATCTEDGKTEGSHCSVCGEIIEEQQIIWATGHKNVYITGEREATCTEEGYTGDRYCQDCGQYLSEGSEIPKKDHIWDLGVTTKTATPLEDGMITYSCTICGEEKEETVPRTKVPGKGMVITDWQNGVQYKVIKSGTDGGTVEYKRSLNINVTEVVIPKTVTFSGITYKVTAVASNAFSLNDKLKKVTIGNNVTVIGKNAFANCEKLVSVKMSENILTIEDKAFYKCKSLSKIIIPSKVKKIGYKTFYGCRNLKSIQIKTKRLALKNVGKQSFKGISAKAVIKVPANKVNSFKRILKTVGIGPKVRIKD